MRALCVAHLVDRAHFRPKGGSPSSARRSCRPAKGVGMNPRRWVHGCAWSSSLIAVACLSAPAWPQIVETHRTSFEIPPDPVVRSPRLLGMGRLTLLDDRDN